jgi:hypothetical protein
MNWQSKANNIDYLAILTRRYFRNLQNNTEYAEHFFILQIMTYKKASKMLAFL